jgi:hypothetical protein
MSETTSRFLAGLLGAVFIMGIIGRIEDYPRRLQTSTFSTSESLSTNNNLHSFPKELLRV